MLSITTDENVHNWDTLLPGLMMAYRSSVHETTKFTPFQMMFGRQVRLPIDIMFGTPEPTPSCPNQYVNQLRSNLEKCYNIVRRNISKEQSHQKEQYDKKQAGSNFTVNDMVWLHNPAKKSKMTWFGYTTLPRRVKTNLVSFTVHGKGHLKYLKSSMM